MGTPLVQRLATSKTVAAPLLLPFLHPSSAVESESNRCIPSLSIDKGSQYMFFSPFPKDSESVHCNFHALSTTDLAILSYH